MTRIFAIIHHHRLLISINESQWSSPPPKCDYRLIIDWLMPIDANQQQLINCHRLIDWFSDHRFLSIVHVLLRSAWDPCAPVILGSSRKQDIKTKNKLVEYPPTTNPGWGIKSRWFYPCNRHKIRLFTSLSSALPLPRPRPRPRPRPLPRPRPPNPPRKPPRPPPAGSESAIAVGKQISAVNFIVLSKASITGKTSLSVVTFFGFIYSFDEISAGNVHVSFAIFLVRPVN